MLGRLEAQLVCAAETAFAKHSRECTREPYLVLLNPGNQMLLGWDELWGLPVLADSRVPPEHCRLVCGEKGWAGSYDGKPVYWLDGEPYELTDPQSSSENASGENHSPE